MVEFLYTLAGLVAGIIVVTSLHRHHSPRYVAERPTPDEEPTEVRESRMEIQVVSDNLQHITSDMSSSVDQHSAEIEHFNAALIDSGAKLPDELSKAIVQVLSANRKMQQQLSEAKQQIEEQKQLIEQTSRQARTDALTGLANRRALEEYLQNELTKGTDKRLAGLLLMDIDHFKKFNDVHGHIVGDAVLRSFGQWLNEICDSDCQPFRYGGEEFAVVIRAETVERMVEKAAMIRQYVSQRSIEHDGMQLGVTASAGLCTLVPGESIQSAYERADEGLYKSKEKGRNRGHWLNGDQWEPFPAIPDGNAPEQEGEPVADVEEPPHAQSEEPDTREVIPKPARITETAELLTLNEFISRLEISLARLYQADLPGSAMMIEMLPDDSQDGGWDREEVWNYLETLLRTNFRGIDIICRFRPHTLCAFIPGCSLEAAIERASRILRSTEHLTEQPTEKIPAHRLAVAVGTAKQLEKGSDFLDRLEDALDAAHAAEPMQIVVHDGETCRYRDV